MDAKKRPFQESRDNAELDLLDGDPKKENNVKANLEKDLEQGKK